MLIYWVKTQILLKNTDDLLLVTRKEVGLEVNAVKTMLMLSCQQTVEQYHNMKITNRYSGNVVKFRYFRTMQTNQNCIYEEIKSRLNLGNA
jgi:hypothetical protein